MEAAKDKALKSGSAAVYFYCESAQRDILKGSDLLASFIKQLLMHFVTICKPCPVEVEREVRKFFGAKRLEPDFDDLADIFLSLYTYTPKTIYVIDGLDEFDGKEARKVLRVVQQLFGSQTKQNGSRILIFSRDQIAPFLDVTRFVPGTARISTSLENIASDIQLYTKDAIKNKMYVRELTSDPALMEETEQKLLEGASGM